mmetsp:Transcript_24014/g.59632  ORF Transcript_24014/g.59632 Transcript_24014/m.59632 type:complete len:187 (-) Transcript_24014:487-1047(-)
MCQPTHMLSCPHSIPFLQAANDVPVFFANKLDSSLILCQTADIDLTLDGDIGVIGRVTADIDDEVFFDIKGVMYSADVFRNHAVALLSIGDNNEAKITSVFDRHVNLTVKDNYLGAMSGVLEGGEEMEIDAGAALVFSQENDATKSAAVDSKSRASSKSAKAKGSSKKPALKAKKTWAAKKRSKKT